MLFFKKNNKFFVVRTFNLKDEEKDIVFNLLINEYKLSPKNLEDHKRWEYLYLFKKYDKESLEYNYQVKTLTNNIVMELCLHKNFVLEMLENLKGDENDENEVSKAEN